MSDLRIEKLSMENSDITQENINKIKELFPQIVTEGKIDFELLKTILGEQIENSNERYQFIWSGKSNAVRFAQKPSVGTLRPDKDSSKNWDTTKNFYIEGDNLEVLKLLQKTYYNKIKMIYIDPPYNTGGDFVYKDDFKDGIKNYKEQTNQKLRTNPETSGRYHTDWLNMMYSRIMLAKNLLTDDGVISISIDDNEYTNLKKICDEIFGEENTISTVVWQRAYAPVNLNKHFSRNHDFICFYAKNINKLKLNKLDRSDKQLQDYKNPDNDPRGAWKVGNPSVGPANQKNIYEVSLPSGRIVLPPNGRSWLYSEDKLKELISDNRIYFGKNGDSTWAPKMFLNEVSKGIVPLTLWEYKEVGHSQDATKELKELFANQSVFEYSKPKKLIERIAKIGINKNDILLDFFSGSATTAHAVMQINAEDGGNRKFIMVQLPEKTDEKSEVYKAGFENICEIGKERIRRAGEKIKNELIEKNRKSGMLEESIDPEKFDIGFRVYKLDSSNFNAFDSSSKDIENIFNHDVFLSDRTQLDILYEILLKYGVFDKPVENLNINGKEAYSVAYGHMLVFINQEITEQDILEVVALKPREVIIDERGFKTDNDKMNAVIRLEAAGVEKISTI